MSYSYNSVAVYEQYVCVHKKPEIDMDNLLVRHIRLNISKKLLHIYLR